MARPRKRRLLDILRMLSQDDQSDVLGSYTGTPAAEGDDVPEQDADDL